MDKQRVIDIINEEMIRRDIAWLEDRIVALKSTNELQYNEEYVNKPIKDKIDYFYDIIEKWLIANGVKGISLPKYQHMTAANYRQSSRDNMDLVVRFRRLFEQFQFGN